MEIVVAVVFIVVLVIVTMYIGLQKKEIIEDEKMPVIHTSGIYSVIRKDPRENLQTAKPGAQDLSDYMAGEARDIKGDALSDDDRAKILSAWNQNLGKNLTIIEEGDKIGVQRFLIKTRPACIPCRLFHEQNYYMTREDIFKHPELIPPYYPGCDCTLEPESEWKTVTDMSRLVPNETGRFPIPSWKNIRKIG
jgi:hypothetical protein